MDLGVLLVRSVLIWAMSCSRSGSGTHSRRPSGCSQTARYAARSPGTTSDGFRAGTAGSAC
jgi:hypothetical protein